MNAVRPIDRWFIDRVLPAEARFLQVARRLAAQDEEARDLVHEAYARLLAGDGWAALIDVEGYTVRIIRNLAVTRMRRARIVRFEQLAAAQPELVPDDAPDPLRVACGRDAAERAQAALAAMPERCRAAVVRCRLGEESPRAVASALGLSLSTLEKRLARGMRLLAAALLPDVPAGSDEARAGQAAAAAAKVTGDVRRTAQG